MDVAYDHIQEEVLSPEEAEKQRAEQGERGAGNLNTEFQEAFKAVSASPWGAKLGGFLGQVKKQSETFYTDAQREYGNASTQATKGLTDLRANLTERTRGMTLPETSSGNTSFSDPTFTLPEQSQSDSSTTNHPSNPTTDSASKSTDTLSNTERPESLPADIVKEATSLVSRFRSEAAKRLQAVQKAEDAADEALLKFGSNVRDFLRDAVTVTAPEALSNVPGLAGVKGFGKEGETSEVLFETADAEGKRVFHSSRSDAQLHVIHTTASSFTADPEHSEEWGRWRGEFDAEKNTDRIAGDLERYEELRRAMSKLVPEKVEYADFWRRYYFLRKAVEEEERRRREVLKGAGAIPKDQEEDLDWGSSDDENESTTPVNGKNKAAQSSATTLTPAKPSEAPSGQQTAEPSTAAESKDNTLAAPSRRSHDEHSNAADSDTSYDMVSGATSRGTGSPKGSPLVAPVETKGKGAEKSKADDEEEDDWE